MLSLALSFMSTTFESIKNHRSSLYEEKDFEDVLELLPEIGNGGLKQPNVW